MNKMKEELNLEIVQNKMTKITNEEFNHDIEYIKLYLKNNNKDFITIEEINSIKKIHTHGTLSRYVRDNYNMLFSEYCKLKNIQIGKQGVGVKHKFYDGEETFSQFEYLLSNFLRSNGLVFNKDYFRDVKYNSIDSSYIGNMNCDYKICFNNKVIYIELAGILRDYKSWYYSDKVIANSKSRESYRIKLKEKEKILKDNNLIYFILFPCDLINNYLHEILYNPTNELKKDIEKHYRHNIDWSLVKNAS
jgi:hypothetical protein